MRKAAFVLVLFHCIFLASILEAGSPFFKIGKTYFNDQEAEDFNGLIFAAGSDYRLFGYAGLGFEVQYAYKGLEGSSNAHFFNGYVNAKAYLGEGPIRPFVGAGLGIQVAAHFQDDFADIEHRNGVGMQFLGGVLLGPPGGISLVGEIQFKKPTGDISDLGSVVILGGISF
jgi:hypothetical protein